MSEQITQTRETAAPGRPSWRAMPTVVVLGLLAGVAVWGHQLGWTLPRLSSGGAVEDDWCTAHGVPESVCIECHPDLLPGKQFGWCKLHGVHNCPLCHPEVAQLEPPVRVTPEDLEQARRALEQGDRPRNGPKCTRHERRIQFASAADADRTGIEVRQAARARMIEFVAANGEIAYDQTRVARLSSRVPGSVWRVDKQVGDAVQQGEVLALVEAAEVGRVKAEFLQAFAQVDLKQRIYQGLEGAGGVVAGRTLQEAEAALREARIRLLSAQQALINLGLPVQAEALKSLSDEALVERIQFLGLPEAIRRGLDPQTTTASLLPIQAPIAGVIVHREVVAGEVVDSGKLLFVVADTRQMWLNLDVRIEDARRLAPGQTVRFQPDGGQRELTGTVTWISTAVDERTRTVKLRAELANPDGSLRAGTFGAGQVILREEPRAVVVPKEAVHWEGCCNIVFVRDKDYLKDGAPKVFHVRKVVPGASNGGHIEIIAGLLPGELVATKGSAALRTELLKNSIGEGCCDHKH